MTRSVATTGPLRARIGLAGGAAACLLLLAIGPPAGLEPAAWRVAAVAVLMASWWISEALPVAATACLPLVLFPLLGVAPIGAAAAPYANPIIFLFLGGFLIAASLQRTGLHRRTALAIVALVGTSPARLVAGFMGATAFLSMWVSNTATVVMMLPVALSILALQPREDAAAGGFPTALLLGLAYAANIGGMGTLIGTPPNALLAGFMDEAYGIEIGFVEWMLLGVPLVALSLPLCWLLLTRVLYRVSREELAGSGAVLAAERARLGRLSGAEWAAGVITALTAALWVARPLLDEALPLLSDAGIAMGGALLLFVAGAGRGEDRALLTWSDAERLPWGVLLLFGGGLSLAAAIESTGLARWAGELLGAAAAWPVVLLVLAVTALVVFLTELTSNTATAAGLLPVVAALAVGAGGSPLLLAVPAVLGASAAFMMPVATPPNAIVFASGRITVPQMARAGLLLNLVFIAVITAAALSLARRVFG